MGRNRRVWYDFPRERSLGRLKARYAELRRANNELSNQVQRLLGENADLRAQVPEPSKPDTIIADVLADPEHMEAYRILAWTDNTRALDHWDAAAGDYAYPDGWPEGVHPADFVAQHHRSSDPTTEPEQQSSSSTLLHKLLDGSG